MRPCFVQNNRGFTATPAISALVLVACQGMPGAEVPDAVSCRNCAIEIEDLGVIGDTTPDASLSGRPMGIWQDGRGRYWINVLDAFPMIYDPAVGRLQDFAKPGGGPDEYRHPTVRSILPGDSILVSDMFTFRVLAPDLQIAREIHGSQDLARLAVVQWPTNVLAITMPYDRAARTMRTVISRYDMSGDRLSVQDTIFATVPSAGGEAEWANSFRLFGRPAASGDMWISEYNHYRLVLYSSEGEALDSIVRRPDWFPGGEPMRLGGPDQPTTPHMLGNWMDDKGRLWTLAAQPRGDTRDAWRGIPSFQGAGEVRGASLPAQYKLNRTIIEVIDPRQRRVIARHTFDGYVIAVLSDQRVASFTETEWGVPVLRLHRLQLRGTD